MIRKILLATDGSASSGRAAEFAASLSRRYNARIFVLHAYTPGPAGEKLTQQGSIYYESSDEAHSLVEQVNLRLEDMGVEGIESNAVEGPPAHVILGVAESSNQDLIVIGARGTSTWQGSRMGSVSLAVTQRAECPVLVVK
jgi:nucleotide-binding universal stress UspA family protein